MKATYLLLGLVVGVLVGRLPEMFQEDEVEVERKEMGVRVERAERVGGRERRDEVEEGDDSSALSIAGLRSPYHTLSVAEVALKVAKLGREDFPGVFERAGEDQEVQTLLYERWGEIDPASALSYLLDETEYDYLDCHEVDRPDWAMMVGVELLKQEGKAGIPAIEKLLERVEEGSIGYNYGDADGFEELFHQWALVDFDSALERWAVQEGGIYYDGVDLGIGKAAAELGRTVEVMELAGNQEDFFDSELVERAARDWAGEDFEAALAWAEREDARFEGKALEGVARVWIEKDVEGFLDWAMKEGRVDLGKYAGGNHPREVARWLTEKDDGSAEWEAVRKSLLRPLRRSGRVKDEDIGFYVGLISQLEGTGEAEREGDYLRELFLKVTRIPMNYDPEDGDVFSLYDGQKLAPYLEEAGFMDEFTAFQEEREVVANRLVVVEKEISALEDERSDLVHGPGFD